MLKSLDLRPFKGTALVNALPRPSIGSNDPTEAVRAILSRVKNEGDSAIHALTIEFDKVDLDSFRIGRDAMEQAYERIDLRLRDALEAAKYSVVRVHEEELKSLGDHELIDNFGMKITYRTKPVYRAGCYVPGGIARYPSSVIMTATIAKVAGVKEVVLCVPPQADGSVDDATLAAAHICDVDYVFCIGGAQAIGAMAYGTESVPKVDVIVGPGNVYVSIAKREVSQLVGVPSSFAGPSEVVVVADESVPPSWSALDLAVQAEHGPNGLAWLITWSEEYALAVEKELEEYLQTALRKEQITSTLEAQGYIALVRDRSQALEISNLIAPEHLELLYHDANQDLDLVDSAGAVFIGPYGTAAYGDYVAGPSHVLPTFGTARFASVLGVSDFRKRMHFIEVTRDAVEQISWAAEELATAEGLQAHGDAIRVRCDEGNLDET